MRRKLFLSSSAWLLAVPIAAAAGLSDGQDTLRVTSIQAQPETPRTLDRLAQADTGTQRHRGPGRGIPPGFEEAAEALGVSVEALMNALRDAGGPPPDLELAASTLGVSAEQLRAILPPPPRRPRQ